MNDAVNPGTMTNGTSAPERSLLRQPGRAAPVGITRAVDNLGMPEGRQSSPRSTPCRDGGSCWGASAATAQLVFCPDLPVGSMTALTMMQTTPRNAEITPKIVNAKPKARRIRATPKAMSTARIGTIVCRDPGSSVVPDRCRSAACGHRASLVRGGVKPRQKHAPFSCQSHGSSVRVREDNGSAHVASWVGQPFWSQGVIGPLGRGIGLTGGGYYSAHGGTR